MTFQKKIAWEKYDYKYIGYDEEDDEDIEEEKPYIKNEESPFDQFMQYQGPKHVPQEILSPFKHFNCHKCNTNFDVTPKVLEVVENVIGIELMIPVSRYSFIVGIGKLFSEADVKTAVKDALLGDIIK